MEEFNHQSQQVNQGTQPRKLGNGLIISILVISLLAGVAGGVLGTLAAIQNKTVDRVFNGEAAKKTLVDESSAIIDVVQKASPAVVSIVVSKNVSQLQSDNDLFLNPFFFDPFFGLRPPPQKQKDAMPNFQEVGAGTGFLVRSDGTIVTNKHVVADENAKYTVFTNDGKQYEAKVLTRDPLNDIAILKININNAPALKLADSSKLQTGQRVIAIGNSLGQYRNTVTTGVVSGIGRSIIAGSPSLGTSEQLEGLIQTDAAINLGNSGGPLLNIYGDVIGVNTAIDQQGQLVGFAIPSNDIERDIKSFDKYGKIKRSFLGVRYVPVTPALKERYNLSVDHGAWLNTPDSRDQGDFVVPGGAGDKAGLKNGDIITHMNGVKIDQNTTLASQIKKYDPDEKITLDVVRAGKNIKIVVTLGEKSVDK